MPSFINRNGAKKKKRVSSRLLGFLFVTAADLPSNCQAAWSSSPVMILRKRSLKNASKLLMSEFNSEQSDLEMALKRAYERDLALSKGGDTNSISGIFSNARPSLSLLNEDQYSTLPFDCTSCGKCCKTKGTVYMAPDEVEDASRLLELSTKEFSEKYASHRAESASKNGRFWLRIKNKKESDGGGCVFLDDDNLCSIYEARPVQCSTYPFWSNILQSSKSWDAEVRETDDMPHGPYWTSVGGGCEGMSYLDDQTIKSDDGHSKTDAFQKLNEYERWKNVFHSCGDFLPIDPRER